MPAQWVTELRELIKNEDLEMRQHALMDWFHRWSISIGQAVLVTREEQEHAKVDFVKMTEDHIRREIGRRLANILVKITTEPYEIGEQVLLRVAGQLHCLGSHAPKGEVCNTIPHTGNAADVNVAPLK